MNLYIIAGMVGVWQIVVIIFVILLLFGGKKIPELMKGLGQGLQEFKKATKEGKDKEQVKEGEQNKLKEKPE